MGFVWARAREDRTIALVLLVLAFSPGGAAAASVDVYDVDQVTVAWEPASGPVAGYHVVAERNGIYELVTSGPALEADVPGSAGDEIRVVVAAYDAVGSVGPLSPHSDTIRFLATPEGDSPPPSPHSDLDFDGDGAADFLLRHPSTAMAIWNMDGSVVRFASVLDGPEPDWAIVDHGDYDGNGGTDIVWERAETRRFAIWLLAGERVVARVSPLISSAPASDGWKVGGSGDFDGDGDDEIFLFSSVLGASEIFGFDADGTTSSRRLTGHVGAWRVDDVGDYDGDGLDEVIWRDTVRHDLVLWDLDASGAPQPRSVASSVDGWRVVGSGDFDGNGADDLFVTHSGSGEVEVWRLEANEIVGRLPLPMSGGAGWVARSVGDHDRDGLADLAWWNLVSGDGEIWFSDGDSISAVPITSRFGSSSSGVAVVVSGTEGSDDSAYRQRLCGGDFDLSGSVTLADLQLFAECAGGTPTGSCAPADMNSDGVLDDADLSWLRVMLERGVPCIQ